MELNPGLAALARENVVRWEALGRPRAPLVITQGDATEFVYPEGACLVFLYNPFGVPVVQEVLRKLHEHVQATGARVDLLYQNEGPEMPMRSDPGLQAIWSRQLPLLGEDAAAELVGTPVDVTSLYRFRR